MKKLNKQIRIKIRMAAARTNPKLAIGGGDKQIKPRPISLPKIPAARHTEGAE